MWGAENPIFSSSRVKIKIWLPHRGLFVIKTYSFIIIFFTIICSSLLSKESLLMPRRSRFSSWTERRVSWNLVSDRTDLILFSANWSGIIHNLKVLHPLKQFHIVLILLPELNIPRHPVKSSQVKSSQPPWNTLKKCFLLQKRPKEDERVAQGHFHERVNESPRSHGNFELSGAIKSFFV